MADMLLGRPVAEEIYNKIAQDVEKLGRAPVVGAVGLPNPQWLQYVKSLEKSASDCGVNVQHVVLPEGVSQEELENTVSYVSSTCDGVIIQQPLPKEYVGAVEQISYLKDLDCLSSLSVAKLYRGETVLQPATPLAVLKLLDFYKIDLCGKNVVIVGRGNTVGKPLALMALKRNATVTICHTKTVDLPSICRRADIVVSACGVAGLITKDFVTNKSIVVDVGLSFVDDKTCGDVSQEVYDVVKVVSPVPGGVGPVTRAVLLENLLTAITSK